MRMQQNYSSISVDKTAVLLSIVKISGIFSQIFVAFSEKLDFIGMRLPKVILKKSFERLSPEGARGSLVFTLTISKIFSRLPISKKLSSQIPQSILN